MLIQVALLKKDTGFGVEEADMDNELSYLGAIASWIAGGLISGWGVTEQYSLGYGLLTIGAFLIVLSLVFGFLLFVKEE